MLSALFTRCLTVPYSQAENGADYATERIGSTLYIYFEHSNGLNDWKNNLSFPAKPYRRMEKTLWLSHRGFLRLWRSVEIPLAPVIADASVRRIVTVGYSHGAAIAVLCHEYIRFHRPDLREATEGYGFGCPRVLFGIPTERIRRRWEHFYVIRNIDDIVTHLPPALLGYFHVGQMLLIGERGRYSPIDAHRPQNILAELIRAESSGLLAPRHFGRRARPLEFPGK